MPPASHLTPELFVAGPARDERFDVKERWIDCTNLPLSDPRRPVEFLHRQMNEEVNGLEASARSLSDFAAADWQIRLGLARQCADEARHAAMFAQLLEARGGHIGQYPVLNFQFRIICRIETLVGRLTVQNRSFEAGGIDAIEAAIAQAAQDGDTDLQHLFEAQIADEILHVRFANEAIDALKAGNPRCLLQMGAALAMAAKAFREVMGKAATDGIRYPGAAQARGEAGFSVAEIENASALVDDLKSQRREP